jgi:serine protease inhibitor
MAIQIPMMNAQSLIVGKYAAFNGDGSFFDTPSQIQRDQLEGLYPDKKGFTILELPYKGDEISMVVIAPTSIQGLASVENKVTADDLTSWLNKLKKRETHVFIPKFKMETDYDLKTILQNLGMKRAFIDPRFFNGADFRGINNSSNPMLRLFISEILHKAFVEVDEKGTEAAAATIIMTSQIKGVSKTIPFIPVFRADRPFLFLIRDMNTGSILFMGRVVNPST